MDSVRVLYHSKKIQIWAETERGSLRGEQFEQSHKGAETCFKKFCADYIYKAVQTGKSVSMATYTF
jgi:hypothetical protein